MQAEPFFFNVNIFDSDGLIQDDKPPLEFTAEQLAQAKEESFQQGKKTGINESQASIARQTMNLAQTIAQKIEMLALEEKQRKAIYEAEAINLALAVFRQCFPVYHQRKGFEEMKEALHKLIQEDKGLEKIRAEIPPALHMPLQEYLDKLEDSPQKNLVLTPNPSLSGYECRLVWEEGGILYNAEKMAAKIASTLEESLAAHSISVHDNTKSTDSEAKKPEGQITGENA